MRTYVRAVRDFVLVFVLVGELVATNTKYTKYLKIRVLVGEFKELLNFRFSPAAPFDNFDSANPLRP